METHNSRFHKQILFNAIKKGQNKTILRLLKKGIRIEEDDEYIIGHYSYQNIIDENVLKNCIDVIIDLIRTLPDSNRFMLSAPKVLIFRGRGGFSRIPRGVKKLTFFQYLLNTIITEYNDYIIRKESRFLHIERRYMCCDDDSDTDDDMSPGWTLRYKSIKKCIFEKEILIKIFNVIKYIIQTKLNLTEDDLNILKYIKNKYGDIDDEFNDWGIKYWSYKLNINTKELIRLCLIDIIKEKIFAVWVYQNIPYSKCDDLTQDIISFI